MGISLGVGAGLGAVGGDVSYVFAHPGRSPSEYLRDPGFWRSVASGAVGGAVAGLAVWALPAPATFWSAAWVGAVSGALGGGAGRVTENLLNPCAACDEGVLGVATVGRPAGASWLVCPTR